MRALQAIAVLAVSLWCLAAPAVSAGNEAAPTIAEADIARWNSAIAKGGPDSIAALFSADAMLIPPNGRAMRDSGQIRAFWKSVLEARRGGYGFALLQARRENGDTLVTRAVLTDSKPLGNSQSVIRYRYQGIVNNVLKRQADGSWKVQVQRWTDGGGLVDAGERKAP